MRCPQCQTENRADRKFCAACGAALERACEACGFKNALSDRFCGGCGRALAGSPAAAAPAIEPTAERRPVAVLIADLASFTRLSAGRDPEQTHRLLARYFEAVDPIVLRHGGTIDKHMGDAVMALFGAPIAHGDDALRAARAATAIHRRLAELSRETGESFSAHVGIALGEVLAGHFGSTGHAAYTVTGDAPTLATRLMEAAPAGETWVDEEIARAVAGLVQCRALPAMPLKGLGTLTVHAIVDGGPAAAPAVRSMIGRRAELAQLSALMAAAADGNGGAVLVRGDPGIGKSTLLQEVAHEAASRAFAAVTTRVLDFGASRETEVAAVLCAHLLRECTGEPGEAGLERALETGDLPQELALFAADLLSLPRSASDMTLYRAMDEATRASGRAKALERLLAAAAQRRPQLVIVEDLHWADAELLRSLAQLAAALSERAGLLLLSTRIDGDPIDTAWRASARQALLSTIELRPLSGADAIQLAQQISAGSEDYMRRCVERAEGNPLFLEQLLRSRATDHDDHLPPSLHGVVLARLDRLGQGDKRAIEAAAILGQRFRLGDLRSLLDEQDYEPAELARRHLVRPEGTEIAFAHALIRDGVYASLTHDRRARLHRAAAGLFEAGDPAMSAEHLDRAGDTAAPRAYLNAAKSEAALLHVTRALSLAERGLAIAQKPDDMFQLAMQVGSLQRDLGRGEPALASYEKAQRHAADENQQIAAMVGMASANRLLGRVAVGLQQTEALAAKIGGIEEDRIAAEFHTLRGNLAFAAADLDLCKTSHKMALAAAERGGSMEWRIRALGGLGDASYAEGYLATARTYFAECVDLADANGFVRIASPNRGMRANCDAYFLAIEEAERQCALALAGARRIGDRYLEMFALECAAFVLCVAERGEQLAESAGEALALSRELKTDRYTSILLVCLITAVRHRRPRSELTCLCEEALELAERTSLTFAGPMIYGVYALVEPDPARQADLIRQGEALLQKTSLVHNHAHFHRFAIEWALEHGHWSEAERLADNLSDYFAAREALPYIDLLVDRARTLAALGRNREDSQALMRAATLCETARSHGLAIPFPPLDRQISPSSSACW